MSLKDWMSLGSAPKKRSKEQARGFWTELTPAERADIRWHWEVQALEDDLPWFGQGYAPLPGKRWAGDRLLGADHYSVLLSWLAGGSAAMIARRTHVARRTVYAVLHQVIYIADPTTTLSRWYGFGLIGGMVIPQIPENVESRWQK